MIDERHTEADEAPHATYVVRSSVVEHPIVTRDDAGSNPVAQPITAFRFTGERFTEPMRLRSYQIDALRQLHGLSGIHLPSVAQLVERRLEAPRVAGSSPALGTRLKP